MISGLKISAAAMSRSRIAEMMLTVVVCLSMACKNLFMLFSLSFYAVLSN